MQGINIFKMDKQRLLELAGIDSVPLNEQEENFRAAFVVDDEGFANVETPESPMWNHTVESAQYSEWVTWAEATRRVYSSLENEHEAKRKFNLFQAHYRANRGRVKIFQDEHLVILVP